MRRAITRLRIFARPRPDRRAALSASGTNGEGSGVLRRTPHFIRHQPACKPGSVGHRPLARTIRDGHSSGTTLARCLEQPTRTASLTLPCGVIAFANSPRCRPYSVLLPVWFAMPVPLPEPRCALTAPFHPCPPSQLALLWRGKLGSLSRRSPGGRRRAVRSLWHYPWGCPRRMLSGTVCRWSPDFPLP